MEEQLSARRPRAEQLRISRVTELSEGWETGVFVLTVEYRTAGRQHEEGLVLRLYEGAFGAQRASREFAIISRLRQAGLPVPNLELLVSAETKLGGPYVVMEQVPGQTLADAILEGGDDDESWLERMVSLLVTLHTFRPADAPLEGLPPPPGVIAPSPVAMRRAAERYELDGFSALLDWVERRSVSVTDTPPCLLHNDYHPGNVIVREADDALFVVDWTFAQLGDYRLDLAWTALLLTAVVGPEYRPRLLESYEEQSGRAVADFDYFEGLKLGARLMTLAAWLTGSLAIPAKKITPDAIRAEYKIHVLRVYERFKEVTGEVIPTFENL